MKNKLITLFIYVFIGANLAGCASTYTIQSKPEGAKVYFVEPGSDRKVYLGATPLNYSKQSLPLDRAFNLSISKDGFKTLEVPMAATDETRTVVNVSLKPDEEMMSPNAREMNDTVRRLFEVQEMIFARKLHEAIIELDKMIKEKPLLVKAYVMKGTAFFLLNDSNAAMASWETAMRLDPSDLSLRKFVNDKRAPASLKEVK